MVTQVRRDLVRPTYRHGHARSAAESARPQDWQGLIGLWLTTLGPSGVTLRDWSGQGNHGTLTTMDPPTDWVLDGNIGGYALDFDGTNDYVALSDTSKLAGISEFTILGWIKVDDLTKLGILYGEGNSGDNDPIISILTHTSGSERRLEVIRRDDVATGLVNSTDITSLISAAVWFQIALVIRGTTFWSYFNRTEVASGSYSAPGTITMNQVAIGARRRIADDVATAQISQVRLYNYAVPSAQIIQIYEDPSGIVRRKQRQYIVPEQAAAAASIAVLRRRREGA